MPVQMKEDESEGEVNIIIHRLKSRSLRMNLKSLAKANSLVNHKAMISLWIL